MKEQITVRELKKLIMSEIQKRPECKEVTRIAITRPANSNWDATFLRKGSPCTCDKASAVIRDLKERFDLEI